MERKSKGTFKELIVWQKAVELATCICHATRSFPTAERFGLTVQLRRAVVSVPSNIAEGNARSTLGEYLQFLSVARGSLAEVETQLIIANWLSPLKMPEPLFGQLQEVRRMLQALVESLRRRREEKAGNPDEGSRNRGF